MSKRKETRRRTFFGVLKWFSMILVVAMLFMPMSVGQNSVDDPGNEVITATELTDTTTTKTVTDTPGIVTLVYTTTYQSERVHAISADEIVPEEVPVEYLPLYTEADAIALAKMAYGESLNTQSDTEIAAAMWCALNRFDSGDAYYRNCKTIESIIKQSGAFAGYAESNPVDDHLLWLAYDVLDRWNAEKNGEIDVGRVLPAEYLFFHGDGKHNYFRIEYEYTGHYYDWSLGSPYES